MKSTSKCFKVDSNGKSVPYKFATGEFEIYKTICELIWGGTILDINWARSTMVYKELVVKMGV